MVIDTKGIILFLNEAARKFQPESQGSFRVGTSVFEGIARQWRVIARNFLETLVTTGQGSCTEISFADIMGRRCHFEIRCSIVPGGEWIIVEGHDVTKQKIFETKITAIAHELNSFIETANAIIIGTDSRGYITEWNKTATSITGYSKNESYTRKFSDLLLYSKTDHPFNALLYDVLEGKSIDNFELTIVGKGDTLLTILINATPRRNVNGDVVGVLIIGQDMTELSQYRRSLEQKVFERTAALEKALGKEKQLVEIKDRFLSIASHEFKSPLSSISNYTESILVNLDKPKLEDAIGGLKKIKEQVRHMSRLLEDVLTIGKNEVVTIQPTLHPVDLKVFLLNIVEEVSVSTTHSHEIQFDFLAPDVTIESDEMLLRNIFINLLTNAIKFSPGRSRVLLLVEALGDWLEIKVQDFGIGILEEDIDRIFTPFSRGRNVAEIDGTGLGLSIVKKAVDVLNGNLTVRSKTCEGTIFTIRFSSLAGRNVRSDSH
jgi:PAS domain S-box-containing protein